MLQDNTTTAVHFWKYPQPNKTYPWKFKQAQYMRIFLV